jgi:hypothetical protein
MEETQRKARGHTFLPPKKVLAKIPALYATDGIPPEQKIIHAHFFSAGTDHYVAELGEDENGNPVTFGYTILAAHPEGQEWGYTSLAELEQARGRSPQGLPVLVERDCHWTPAPFSAIKGLNHQAHADASAQPPVPAPQDAGQGGAEPALACPECDEDAVRRPATDLVPWEAQGLDPPGWSHRDGSALCPVIGPDGYEPARPRPALPHAGAADPGHQDLPEIAWTRVPPGTRADASADDDPGARDEPWPAPRGSRWAHPVRDEPDREAGT